MSAIAFSCPGCGQSLEAPADSIGKQFSCPRCKTPVELVDFPPLPPPAPPPPPTKRCRSCGTYAHPVWGKDKLNVGLLVCLILFFLPLMWLPWVIRKDVWKCPDCDAANCYW